MCPFLRLLWSVFFSGFAGRVSGYLRRASWKHFLVSGGSFVSRWGLAGGRFSRGSREGGVGWLASGKWEILGKGGFPFFYHRAARHPTRGLQPGRFFSLLCTNNLPRGTSHGQCLFFTCSVSFVPPFVRSVFTRGVGRRRLCHGCRSSVRLQE